MTEQQRASFEAWYDSYDMRIPQDPFDRWLARKAWDAAMQSPEGSLKTHTLVSNDELQALKDALQEVVDAADGDGWNVLDASLEKQRAALAAMEKLK